MRFSLWYAPDENRVGVSWTETVHPVAGYIVRNADNTWSVERDGKVLPEKYAGAQAAAEVVLYCDSR